MGHAARHTQLAQHQTARLSTRRALPAARERPASPHRRSNRIRLPLLAAIAATIYLAALTGAATTIAHAYAYAPGCNSRSCEIRVKTRIVNEQRRAVVKPYTTWLARVARCESSSNWRINTGNGFYGGVQFTLSSWKAVGGRGYPHHATKLEQSYRAVRLLRLQGAGAWPHCGR